MTTRVATRRKARWPKVRPTTKEPATRRNRNALIMGIRKQCRPLSNRLHSCTGCSENFRPTLIFRRRSKFRVRKSPSSAFRWTSFISRLYPAYIPFTFVASRTDNGPAIKRNGANWIAGFSRSELPRIESYHLFAFNSPFDSLPLPITRHGRRHVNLVIGPRYNSKRQYVSIKTR